MVKPRKVQELDEYLIVEMYDDHVVLCLPEVDEEIELTRPQVRELMAMFIEFLAETSPKEASR
jgi:hypothetical protein